MKQATVALLISACVLALISESVGVSPVGPDPCPPKVCDCTRENKPVCATDGAVKRLFQNDCLRKCEQCKTRIFWTAYETLDLCNTSADSGTDGLPNIGGVKPLF